MYGIGVLLFIYMNYLSKFNGILISITIVSQHNGLPYILIYINIRGQLQG